MKLIFVAVLTLLTGCSGVENFWKDVESIEATETLKVKHVDHE
jgi:hypothetical protein